MGEVSPLRPPRKRGEPPKINNKMDNDDADTEHCANCDGPNGQ